MKIQEVIDTLNRLSPELQPWMTSCRQMFVQIATLEIPIPIDKQELDGLSDDEIKELIRGRIISTLKDRLAHEIGERDAN